jgi:glycosyltransferase involved in cell wall biosynthesis
LDEEVKLVGLRNEVPELLSLTDVFVMPSVQEIFGLAVVEAMAAGKAVLAPDVGGIPEIVRHGEEDKTFSYHRMTPRHSRGRWLV